MEMDVLSKTKCFMFVTKSYLLFALPLRMKNDRDNLASFEWNPLSTVEFQMYAKRFIHRSQLQAIKLPEW